MLIAIATLACSNLKTSASISFDDPNPSPSKNIVVPYSEPPERDSIAIARRYGKTIEPIPPGRLFREQKLGTLGTFWVVQPSEPRVSQVEATLAWVSPRALWYVETSTTFAVSELKKTALRFEADIAPTILSEFGRGLQLPGPISILHAPLQSRDKSVDFGGYFNASDAEPSELNPYSNEWAGLVVNSALEIGSDRYLSTLTHELQHLVHWFIDPGEETWLNEGLSESAVQIMGMDRVPVQNYLRDPTISLVNWPLDADLGLAHYAGSSLLMDYLRERLPTAGFGALVAEKRDGIAGIDAVIKRELPGSSFSSVLLDWHVANLLSEPNPPFGYSTLPNPIKPELTISRHGLWSASIGQFGAWYIEIDVPGPYSVEVRAPEYVSVFPHKSGLQPPCWWSNRGDSINTTLTKEFDLLEVEKATLSFSHRHRIEENWDYGYVSILVQGESAWKPLVGQTTTTNNPMGKSWGPSYTGVTEGWEGETVDLTEYTGNKIMLRFEYVTDDSSAGPGWCINDIRIPEIGYSSAESGLRRGWDANGFLMTGPGAIPQTIQALAIYQSKGSTVIAPVASGTSAETTFEAVGNITLVISPSAALSTGPVALTVAVNEGHGSPNR